MLRNLIMLPNGTEIFSGAGTVNAVQSTTITQSVNSGTELTLGSVCAAALDMKLITPKGNLNLAAGDEITLYKVPEFGDWTKVGLFTLEAPTRPSMNTYKIIAYDRVSWLDKDLSTWFASLAGWPYTLHTLARMTCEACGLTLITEEFPNGDYSVDKFQPKEVTGRRLMEWIGQIACRFVRATPDGEIEFAWYTHSGVTLTPNGQRYFSGLKYEGTVAPIDAVQIRFNDGESALCLPMAEEGANCYVIEGNPMLPGLTEMVQACLEVIRTELEGLTYTPCRVTLPACMDISAGQMVDIVDYNGHTITTCVMTKTQKGQRDTLESTGSARRDSSTATNNISGRAYADRAVERQTQMDIFNKLTRNGTVQGIWLENGYLYVDASIIRSGQIQTALLDLTGKFKVYDGSGGVMGGCMGYLPGADGSGRTDGIGVSNVNDDCYAIVTSAGVRLQAGGTHFYIALDNGHVVTNGKLLARGGLVVEGDLEVTGRLIVNGVDITPEPDPEPDEGADPETGEVEGGT